MMSSLPDGRFYGLRHLGMWWVRWFIFAFFTDNLGTQLAQGRSAASRAGPRFKYLNVNFHRQRVSTRGPLKPRAERGAPSYRYS